MFVVAVTICSYGANNKEKNEVRVYLGMVFEQVGKSLQGMVIDSITVCDSAVFKNDRVYYYYTINEEYLPISQMEAEKSLRRDAVKSSINGNNDMLFLVDMLKRLDGGFTFVYRGNATGNVVSFDIDY